MTLPVRTRALMVAVLVAAAAGAPAQPGEWPARPITLVVCFPAGGSSDALARPLAQKLSEQLHLAFGPIPSAVTQIRGGKVKAIAVTTAKRSFALPDVPTLSEAGMPGFDVPVWYGLAAPAGTPRAVVEKLNATINQILDAGD